MYASLGFSELSINGFDFRISPVVLLSMLRKTYKRSWKYSRKDSTYQFKTRWGHFVSLEGCLCVCLLSRWTSFSFGIFQVLTTNISPLSLQNIESGKPLISDGYCYMISTVPVHDDVSKWKHFPRYWPFVRVDSTHKGQRRGALMFSFICAWWNDWENNRDAGHFRRYCAHYDDTVM